MLLVEVESKNNTQLVVLLSKCPQGLKLFYGWPVVYFLDDFGILLLGYQMFLWL